MSGASLSCGAADAGETTTLADESSTSFRLGAGGNHGLDFLGIDALHEVLELADLRAHQRLLRLLPAGDRVVEKLAHVLGHLGQHGGQINGQLAEEVQPDRADVELPPGLLRAAEVPGGVLVDELVGPIGGGHDDPHRPGEIAGLIGLGNRFAVLGRLGEQPAVVGIGRGQPALSHEIRRAAGQVDELAHHVGVDLALELVEIQVEVLDVAASSFEA